MCPDDDISSICSDPGLILKRVHNITVHLCVCAHVCLPACGLFVCVCFASAILSMRRQQLVKCYQVDEKLQQIPFIISRKRKLTT